MVSNNNNNNKIHFFFFFRKLRSSLFLNFIHPTDEARAIFHTGRLVFSPCLLSEFCLTIFWNNILNWPQSLFFLLAAHSLFQPLAQFPSCGHFFAFSFSHNRDLFLLIYLIIPMSPVHLLTLTFFCSPFMGWRGSLVGYSPGDCKERDMT